MRIVQINLQPYFGGGEVYTAFLCQALSRLGYPSHLITHERAKFWQGLHLPPDAHISSIAPHELPACSLGEEPLWLIGHGPLPRALLAPVPRRQRTAIVHMPVQGRGHAHYADHDLLFAVSGWVKSGLLEANLPVWPEPLYGVAHLSARPTTSAPICRRSRYDWDRRKFRDRLLSWLEPLWEMVRPHPEFRRRPGMTLGIVSRITPIKQFPTLFAIIAPILARYEVNLEIFGAGGYASLRDLEHALRPMAAQVRYWGHQRDVATIYRSLDYLLTGLPEKEALGLNVLEAQACGTPVLAPAAPPFTETVIDGVTGFLYRDPRIDDGQDFERLINRLLVLPQRLEPQRATAHLARFSMEAFVQRLAPVVKEMEARCHS